MSDFIPDGSVNCVTFKAYRINQSRRFPKVESSDVSIQYGRVYFKLFHVVSYVIPGNTYSKSLGNYLNIYPQMHHVLPPQQHYESHQRSRSTETSRPLLSSRKL